MVRSPNLVLTPLKSASKSGLHLLFALPKSSFGRDNVGRSNEPFEASDSAKFFATDSRMLPYLILAQVFIL